MNLFFEESGDFKAGVVLSHAGDSYQVELPGGKRVKVRARDVLLQYTNQTPAHLLEDAHAIADDVDLDFLWEVAGQDEFGFADLGKEYFGHDPLPHEAAGLLFRLHSAPMYFYKRGKGRYKAAPPDALKAALVSIERKKQQAIIQEQYVETLKARRLPEAMQSLAIPLLFKPDKNSIEYKALSAACTELQTTPQRLMLDVGGIVSPLDLHLSKFLFEYFPKGAGFPSIPIPESSANLPVADVSAFSVDDVTTTEIDDAFSVKRLEDGMVRIGIHIAAPGLAIQPDDAIDHIARHRLSTVYMPGDKITMLPDELVERYTLGAGQTRPALSLYTTLNPADWSAIDVQTKIELVHIASNLHHNVMDALVTEEALSNNTGDFPHKEEITLLWQWANVLAQGRMAKRESFGLRPEQTNRVDFNFYVENGLVKIERRNRGAPLDKIVAELMIYANCAWGKLMHEHGVPGIYRSQGRSGGGGWVARMMVRMGTHAAPHQGLGVDQYAWSTSPLRRYTDLVNQWQIMACVRHGVTAPLSAPFRHKDADLFAIISSFEAAYGAYADFQTRMERYWCLRWLAQENIRQADAVVLREDVLRLTDIPLIIRLPGMQPLARGAQVRLDLLHWDEVDLTIEARLLEIKSTDPASLDLPEEDEEDDGTTTPLASDLSSEIISDVVSEPAPDASTGGSAV
ncbi:MAG: RNB domain-containing ribonuclease [Oxalobacter sp.]|nr:MAG: RNB domain-containing ribonuclease [Oxalobacter sp.]